MTENFEDFIETVREANPIEDVMTESGIVLKGHGRLRTGVKHDSLKVRTDMGRAFWYSQNWNGDVFAWVMREKGFEFSQALEYLAKRAHVEMPRFTREVNESELKRSRTTADVFSVAAGVFHRWLMPVSGSTSQVTGDEEALKYARSRAWSDETLRAEMIGFSGRRTEAQVKDMTGEFNLFGIDRFAPAAVAVLGLDPAAEGMSISEWATKQGIFEEAKAEGLLDKHRIHGLMDTPGLIYAHTWRGAVNYLSRRQLPGFDKIKEEDKERDWKSFNPNKILVGAKQMYVNHAQRADQPLICVEGQGDAISYGQLGFGAMAFCGLMGEIAHMTPEDAERLRKMAAWINKHPAVYLFLDDDEPGQAAVKQAAHLIGMKVQVGRMTRLMPREEVENG